MKVEGEVQEKGATVMPWLERGPGSDVTLCINDANLCPEKCAHMTQGI